MSKNERTAGRVVLAIDTASLTLPAMEAAVALAASLHLGLLTLFIADPALLGRGPSQLRSSLDADQAADLGLNRAFALQAEHLRRMVGTLAGTFAVPSMFELNRGESVATALARLTHGDTLVLQEGPPSRFTIGAGGTFPALSGRPIAALFDESAGGRRVLRTAAALARGVDTELMVLIPAARGASFTALQKEAARRVAGEQPDGAGRGGAEPSTATRYVQVETRDAGALARGARSADAGAFVWLLPPQNAAAALTELKAEMACPVLSLKL
jgi:hypothetical protein